MKGKSCQLGRSGRHLTSEEKGAVLKEYEGSGLSLLAFAGREGLCYSSLLRWKRRWGSEAKATVRPEAGGTPGFVPVEIEGEAAGGDYVLTWPGGVSLRIPRQFEPDSLRGLLMVLEARK